MSSALGAISFKQATQVATFAFAYQTLSPVDFTSTIYTLAMGEIGCIGIDLADRSRKWVKETEVLHQDLQQLLDDAELYQEYLGLEPFLPAHDCQTEIVSTFPDKREISSDGLIVLPSEIIEILFSYMTVEELARFSTVSKFCYVATKTDSIWQCQLNKLFPKLICIPREKCGLTPEQQFKIVYRRTQRLLNQYNAMYKKNAEAAENLYDYCSKPYRASDRIHEARVERRANRLYQLVGRHRYDGEDTSIDSNSYQGQIITCIKELEEDYQAFATPGRFEEYIRQAKKMLDVKNRLKDFPQRVKKMQTLAERDFFTDTYIFTMIENDDVKSFKFPLKLKFLFYATCIFYKTLETTAILIKPTIKNRTIKYLDKMLKYQPRSSWDKALFHYL